MTEYRFFTPRFRLLLLTAGLLWLSVAPAQGDGTVLEVAAETPEFSTLVNVIDAAGLTETLRGDGPFTIFAPYNDAFAKIDKATLDTLLADPTGDLTSILTYHVVPGQLGPDEAQEAPAAPHRAPPLRRGAAAGGSGIITPDLIPDEAGAWLSAADAHGLCPIFLLAPSSTTDRIAMTTSVCRGFVYAASLMGVTGERTSVGEAAGALVARVREATDESHLPICVGLGVSNREQAAQVAAFADGVIVGSALVKALDPSRPFSAALTSLRAGARELRAGVEEGRTPR